MAILNTQVTYGRYVAFDGLVLKLLFLESRDEKTQSTFGCRQWNN